MVQRLEHARRLEDAVAAEADADGATDCLTHIPKRPARSFDDARARLRTRALYSSALSLMTTV